MVSGAVVTMISPEVSAWVCAASWLETGMVFAGAVWQPVISAMERAAAAKPAKGENRLLSAIG